MTGRRPRSTWLVPVLLGASAVVIAAIVVVVGGGGDGDDGPTTTTAPAVAVTSDAPLHADVAALVAASDLVVRGRVEASERGRWFGSGAPGETRIQSRVLTVRVDEVLAGRAPSGPSVLVEEEGWLDDGRPVVVDGTVTVSVGDDAVWFLVETGDPDLGAYVLVGAQGRYLVGDDDTLTGPDGDDPLVASLVDGDVDQLAAAVRDAA